jgi:2-methylcitrate dehydratase PrpD
MSLIRDVVDGVNSVDAIPERVERCASFHILDAVGVGFAATASKIGEPWILHSATVVGASGPASIFGQTLGAKPADAVLVNGSLMHSLEFDDTHTGSIAHGSSVLAAAVIAAFEGSRVQVDEDQGRAILRLYILWYEVLIRIGLASPGGFQNNGFQLTSVGGAICAAGLAAHQRGMDHVKTTAAMSIALSQASGVLEFLANGSTVKSMHPGWAGHCGLIAAELAEAGLTGPDTALEGRFGLFRVFADDDQASERLAKHLETLGEYWHLEEVAFKFLPCCHYLHSFVEAAAKLSKSEVEIEQIKEIEFKVPSGAAAVICEPWNHKCEASGHSARWSLPITVAMQLVDGEINLKSFEGQVSPAVKSLARRSRWSVMKDSNFPGRLDAAIRFHLKNGELLETRVDDVYGSASRPASENTIYEKFIENMIQITTKREAEQLANTILDLPKLQNIETLTEALRTASRRNS